jgi:hypothetical protein
LFNDDETRNMVARLLFGSGPKKPNATELFEQTLFVDPESIRNNGSPLGSSPLACGGRNAQRFVCLFLLTRSLALAAIYNVGDPARPFTIFGMTCPRNVERLYQKWFRLKTIRPTESSYR